MGAQSNGKLVILSGPSGVGKSTVVRRLLQQCPLPLELSVSATTRPPRPGEQDGQDYHFLTPEEFERRRLAGEFLESFEVFGKGHWYGTLRADVVDRLAAQRWVLLEIDVQGAQEVLHSYPDAITIFLTPESLDELERRLRNRNTENEASIERRLATAREELKQADFYRHHVVNDDVERAVREIIDTLTQTGD